MRLKIISCSLALCVLVTAGYSQKAAKSLWHGFEKESFSIEGRNAYVVKPVHSLPGNPWVWRAYFPDWHYEMDSILISRGFHIAFIDCSDMYGSPAAMQIWESFYRYLVNHYSFAKKSVLEGVSRGGLYIYAWAKRNPEKVSCIYAEAPVLDIKSWPGGKGNGAGSPEDWKKCLSSYSFTEEEALNFNDNPIDSIEALAAYKIPIVHVVCASDSVVPVAENTSIFAAKYRKLGGIIMVDSMNNNISLMGHHFNIDHPEHYADFIIQCAVPVKKMLEPSTFIELNGKLNNTMSAIRNKRKLTVAFLGGSITYNPGWRDKTCKYLKEAYPQTTFTFLAAGIPSLGSVPHAFRLQSDVLDKGKIDLLFLEAAVNDHANSTDSILQYRAMEGIIRHALAANPFINIVLMAFADEDKNHDFENNIEPLEVRVHRQLAEYYHLPFLNLSKEVYERISNGEFTWKDDFKDLHPSPYGQNIYYQSIKALLQLSAQEYSGEILSGAKLPLPLNKSCYDNGVYESVHNASALHGFSVDENWQPADKKPTREGFVNVPVLEATKPGSSFKFSFNGNTVGIAVISGPDAGIIQYRIDKGKFHTVNLFTQWSNSLHLPWYLILADSLQTGKHLLEVEIPSAKGNVEGNACRIVYFLVNK